MASNAPKQGRLSPRRLCQAEQHAAQAYKSSFRAMYPTSFDPSSMASSTYLCQDWPIPVYQAGLTSAHCGSTDMDGAAAQLKHAAAPPHRTEQVITASSYKQRTFSEYEKYHIIKADANGFPTRFRATKWEAKLNNRKHSRTHDVEETPRKYGKFINDHSTQNSTLEPKLTDDRHIAQVNAVVKHQTAPSTSKHTEDSCGVIDNVKRGDKVDHRDGGIELEPSHPFTSSARTHSASVPVVLPIRVPSLFTLQKSHPNQCEDSSTASELEQSLIDTPATDTSTTTFEEAILSPRRTLDLSTAVSDMSDQTHQEVDHQNNLANNMSPKPDHLVPTSDAKPTLRRWSIVSGVEKMQGMLRTTSDGHLGGTIIEEETGEIISLNKPDDIAQKHYEETHELAPVKRINAPEAKNGGTGADNPRARKPVHRVIKNWMTGSNRLPPDEPLKIFQVGDREPGRVNFEEMIKTRRHHGGTDTRYIMQKIIKRFWGAEVAKRFGEDWVGKADSHELYMQELEDFVLSLTVDKAKLEDQEEVAETSQVAKATADDTQKKPKSGSSWWW